MRSKLVKIVSGGQTGADRGGLAAAIHCHLPHGGWCPKGRRSEDGNIPAKYQLQESPSRNYEVRNEANVVDSDCTAIFTCGAMGTGSSKTAKFAKKHNKPYLHVDLEKLSRKESTDLVIRWLREKCPSKCVLNVAGSRASKVPKIEGAVFVRMIDVISAVNGKLFYPLGDDAVPADDDDDGDDGDKERIGDLDRVHLAEIEWAKGLVKQQAEPAVLYHPKTIEEAVETILKVLPAEKKDMIRQEPKDNFVVLSHLGLGAAIRNSMIYQNENQIDLMADFQRGCREGRWQGDVEADAVSRVIIEQVWERLQGEKG